MSDQTGVKPLNRTARASYQVVGNPVVTRPEDAVANCFPGLEIDVRNFDRRFFPGLVFEFISASANSQPNDIGARLAYVDADADPDVKPDLLALLNDDAGTFAALQQGTWFIESISQGDLTLGMRPLPSNGSAAPPFDGVTVWRLVRSLTYDKVTITLLRRDVSGGPTVTLTAKRRRFTDETTGVINAAYQPGELLQSLCSPWQHDFRDCYCNYWAANHPDLVFAEIPEGETLPGGLAKDPVGANVRLDWLRAERDPKISAAAQESNKLNRPYQYDHYQINTEWTRLPFVLNDTEEGTIYKPVPEREAMPFATPQLLVTELRDTLAPLEMALALEYLYARDSLLTPEEVLKSPLARKWPLLADHVRFARQALLLTGVSEMQHLRLANQLLWQLYQSNAALGIAGSFKPVLEPAGDLPTGKRGASGNPKKRPATLQPLFPSVLQQYIDVESPSATINGAYVRVVRTLQDPAYGADLLPISERIAAEGMEHEARFRYIKSVFEPYDAAGAPYPYLRNDIKPAAPNDPLLKDAIKHFDDIKNELRDGYAKAGDNKLDSLGKCVVKARAAMTKLLAESARLAADDVGIPYFSIT